MTSNYIPSLLDDHKILYWKRRELLEKINLSETIKKECRYYLDVEAKNILNGIIEQRIKYRLNKKQESRSELLIWLMQLLEEDLWKNVKESLSTRPQKDFAALLIAGDAESILNTISKQLKKSRLKNVLKRLVAFLLSKI